MDKQTRKWLDIVAKASLKGIDDSDNFMGIYTAKYVNDPVCLMQLGYAIVTNKPIFLIAEEGVHIPDRLRAVAEGIEVFKKGDDDEDFKAAAARLCDAVASRERRQ